MVRKLVPLFLISLLPLAAAAAPGGQRSRSASTSGIGGRSSSGVVPAGVQMDGTDEKTIDLASYVRILEFDAAPQKVKNKQVKTKDKIKDKENDEDDDAEATQKEREEELYDDGTDALDDGHWEDAIRKFDALAQMKGYKANAALYWKAYAENRLGRRADALATIAALRHDYPQSRWLNDAKALEVEVRQSSGQPVRPENEGDCELKLLAINGLMNSEPERAVPLLEKVLQGDNKCGKASEKALFVLAQTGTPEARNVIGRIARGQEHPELQRKAIQYLGLFGGSASHQLLADVYSGSSDIRLKKQILQSFMIGGERDRLLAAAKTEKEPELRREAIRQLGVLGAQNELFQLYQNESSDENKAAILQAMFVGGGSDKLIELARQEQNPKLRRLAIRNLGLMGASRTGDALVSMYASDKDTEDRRAVIQALFLENNAHALIEIARKETDPELKKDAVQKLSLMHSKEATDFMMEILNK
jgi:HEAT repeat protein